MFFVKLNLIQMPEKASHIVTDKKRTIVEELDKRLKNAS